MKEWYKKPLYKVFKITLISNRGKEEFQELHVRSWYEAQQRFNQVMFDMHSKKEGFEIVERGGVRTLVHASADPITEGELIDTYFDGTNVYTVRT